MTSFFESDTKHGFVKRHIFGCHVEAFLAKTQKTALQSIIYDAFAGAGCYSADLPIEINKYGSPLIALYAVIRFHKLEYNHVRSVDVPKFKGPIKHIKKNIQMPEPKKDVILNFSEADKDNCLKLVNNIFIVLNTTDVKFTMSTNSDGVITIKSDDRKFPVCINVARTKFTHVMPPKDKPKRRLLAFIDPFGYSQIPMQHVQGFIGERREALINFMSSYVNRFKEQENNEDAICELYGFRDEEKRVRLEDLRFELDEVDGIDRCLQMYEKELKKRANSKFILTFAVRDKKNIRRYHLTFITNHIEGFKAMKEAMNRGSQDADCLSMSDYKVEKKGMQLSLGNDQDNEVVAAEIFRKFQGQEKVEISDIENFIWFETPFVWRIKPLKILQKEPEENPRLITVADKNGDPPRRRYTFPDLPKWRLTFRPQSVYDLYFQDVLTL